MTHISLSSVVVAASLITSTAILAQAESIQLTLPTNPPQTLSETITRTFTNDLPPLSNDIPSQTSVTICPTIVSLTAVCSECVTIACVAPLTVTAPCGCPDQPVTIYDAHPCGMGCAGLEGCQTETTVVTPTYCPSGSGSGSGSAGPSSTGSGSSVESIPTGGASETGVSSSEPSETRTSTETTVIVTTTNTDTPSAPVSTLPPTSRSSTAAAARLTPFRLW